MPDAQIPQEGGSPLAPLQEGVLATRYRTDFSGGVNYYLGARQINDNESPNATDCDFVGSTGVGPRPGYAQAGTIVAGRTNIVGMADFYTTSLYQLVRFADNATNVSLAYGTGTTWTEVVTTTWTTGYNVDCVEAGYKLYMFNGVDALNSWDGSAIAAATGGTVGLYGAFFDLRLWCVDQSNPDTLKFSVKYGDATQSLSFTTTGTSSDKGTVTINTGSGIRITGIKAFKNSLYVFTSNAIYQLSTTSTANVFSVTGISNSIGCVSHRSIAIVENDIYFASDYGIYALGEVGTYVSVRATNKSLRVQPVYDNLTGTLKQKMIGFYYKYKYHLFYSLYGSVNDSCLVYDIRYQAWHDWRTISGGGVSTYRDSTNKLRFFCGDSTTGKVYELYSGTTNDGTAIATTWYSKSFDEYLPDVEKLFFDTSFIFGVLSGTVTVSVIFDDTITTVTKDISAVLPQGGFGRDAFGVKVWGGATQNVTVTSVINTPLRLKAKYTKFAIQYYLSSSTNWRLDRLTQSLQIFNHFKFPSSNKLN